MDDSDRAARAAPTSDERKGRTRLPSLDVPSGKRTTTSPRTRRCAISAFALAVALRRARSRNTQRWSLAKAPTTGQPATSDFAIKDSGCSEPSTGMSSHETWFASTSLGPPWLSAPFTTTRMSKRRRKRRCSATGSHRARGPLRRMLSACGPTIKTKTTQKTTSLAATPIQVIGSQNCGVGYDPRGLTFADAAVAPSWGVQLVGERHCVEFKPVVDEAEAQTPANLGLQGLDLFGAKLDYRAGAEVDEVIVVSLSRVLIARTSVPKFQ